jgi:uncharacterized protein involved in exopolysaccharide biosynthesis
MIVNRELGFDDYLVIARRRLGLVLLPLLICALLGFLISFILTPKYTSRSLLLVEDQMVPAGYVKPIVTERVSDRMTILTQNVLSRTRLQALVSQLGLARKGQSIDDVIDTIRDNVSVTEAEPGVPPPGSSSSSSSSSTSTNSNPANSWRKKPAPGDTADVPGFYVSFTTNNARDAQQVCAEITSMLLEENLQLRERVAQSTTDFLARQLDEAKRNLDDLDNRLSDFKKAHIGRLPSDEDRNLKLLTAFNSQLDANSQTLNRAQQDLSFTQSLLAEEEKVWQDAQGPPTLPTLKQQLVNLEDQLVMLQARYTDDYPDVVKTKRDIAKIQAKLKELKSAGNPNDALPAKLEPPEILQLKHQAHQDEQIIGQATDNQKRLQKTIDLYQSQLSLSPEIEEQYKQLTRDNETAHSIYDNLLSNKSAAEMQTEMERKQQGEQMRLLDPASLPSSPSFPIRWMFAAGGAAAGLCLGLVAAMWLELRDKSMRDEADVSAALQLPTLATVPWVGGDENGDYGKRKFPFGLHDKKAAQLSH